MRRYPLGDYPVLGISQARSAARDMHHKVKHEGADPVADRRRERERAAAAREGVGTLASIIELYGRQKGEKQRSWAEYQASIRRVFGGFLARPAAEVTLADLQLAADRYPAQQQASLACRCFRPILKWAGAPGREYVGSELASLQPPATPRRRDRVLSRDELATVLPALRASTRPHAAAMLFMLLTLARREEVGGMRWRDVNLDEGTWQIGADRSKNEQPHRVPLSRQAVALLRARLPVGEGGEPFPADPDALVFATGKGRALDNWHKETVAIHAASGTSGWHRHDLRRTGATWLGDMGELPDIIEAALNHTSIRSPLAATYNRSRYRPQVAAALQRLADALDGIEAGGAAVVPLWKAG